MTAPRSRFLRAVPVHLALLTAPVLVPAARADSISFISSNDAIAGVMASGQSSVQSGSTPAAIDQTGVIHVMGYDANGNWSGSSVTATVGASASASATPATGSLQLYLAFSAPSPGNYAGPAALTSPDAAFADWPNVTTTVKAPAGSPMPSSIWLEFQVNYTPPPADGNHANSEISVLLPTSALPVLLGPVGYSPQINEPQAQVQPDGTMTGTFQFNVPLSPTGVSTSPFSMLLQDWVIGLRPNAATTFNDVASIALKAIDGPGGSSLTEEGYTVSFQAAPGFLQFTPDPEPATWAAWVVIAAAGSLILRRHRARM